MEASKVTIMAMVVLTLIISPAIVVSDNVDEAAAVPNLDPLDPKNVKCQIRCGAECVIDPKPNACILTCMANCLGGQASTNANFCTTGCMLTTCFNGKPGIGYTKDTVKSCVKSCSDGCDNNNLA